ncbi:MAG: diguanylate cyclase [Rhodocyclales bacterium]|nr:diguanylate cyclase [Rhodocyclales bacterium]
MAPSQPPVPGQVGQAIAESCTESDACPTFARLNARLANLEMQVSTDYLTGLWNRAHFNQVVDSELDRSLRYKQPVSLILFDIDHFKRANDQFGHQAGDAVLRELALVANAATRSSDAVFRWGGEEFAVLATSTGYRGAGRLAEALRGQVACHVFPDVGTVTVSLGVAEHSASESAEAWFRRADGMLYAAKREGRNCVRVDANGNSDTWAAAQGPAALCLSWQEAYECGEPSIDREHLELFNLANALIDVSVMSNSDSGKVLSVFDKLLDHIACHFVNEEALLELRGYAHADAHRRAHANLLRRARALRDGLEAGSASLGGIVEFLAGEVVARHLFKADRDFFPLFRAGAGNAETVPVA